MTQCPDFDMQPEKLRECIDERQSAHPTDDEGAGGFLGGTPNPHRQARLLLPQEDKRENPQSRSGQGLWDSAIRGEGPSKELNLFLGHIKPGHFSKKWVPWNGYAPVILKNAKIIANTPKQAKLMARLDAFLYASVIGRIPSKTMKSLSRARKGLIDKKIQAGHWIELRDFVRFYDCFGNPDGEARIYCLSPSYRLEIVRSGIQHGHYSCISHLRHCIKAKPSPPPVVTGTGLPNTLKNALIQGTGLTPNLVKLSLIISNPSDYLSLPGAPDKAHLVFAKAVKDWRILSPLLPNEEMRPNWSLVKECMWIYSSKPCIQQLSAMSRLNVLQGVDGKPLSEVDYIGCQMNIARYMEGEALYDDPYKPVLNFVLHHSKGTPWEKITRQTIKELTLPMLHGRTRENYIYLWFQKEVAYPVELYDLILEVLPDLRGHPLMRYQGDIMIKALEILTADGTPPGLPVFDSILSPFPEKVETAMKEASMLILGSEEPLPTSIKDSLQTTLELA